MKKNVGTGKKVVTAVLLSAAIVAGSFAAFGAKKSAYTFQSGGAKIRLGATREAVEKAYGRGYREEEGVLYYTLGDTELKIYLTNDVVDGIEYLIADAS